MRGVMRAWRAAQRSSRSPKMEEWPEHGFFWHLQLSPPPVHRDRLPCWPLSCLLLGLSFQTTHPVVLLCDQEGLGRKSKANQVKALKHSDNNHLVSLMADPTLLHQKAEKSWNTLLKSNKSQFHSFSSTLSTIRQWETLTLWCLYPQSSALFMLDVKFYTFKTGSECKGRRRSSEFVFRICTCSPAFSLMDCVVCSTERQQERALLSFQLGFF